MERRFIARGLPPAPTPVRIAEISDLYISGTRLRLRRTVERTASATTVVYKLTQKVPDPDGSPGWITTVYLSEAEHEVLARLRGAGFAKTRYSIPPFGVDVFEAPLDGLILAEIEFDSDEELSRFQPPSWSVAEVTADVRFSGGSLVAASREDLKGWLRDYRIDLMA